MAFFSTRVSVGTPVRTQITEGSQDENTLGCME